MGPGASAVPGDEPSGVAVAPSLGSSGLQVSHLQLPFAAQNRGTRGITRRLPEGRRPQTSHKGRFVPRSAQPRPQRRAGGGPPRSLGAGVPGLGQQTDKAVYTGRQAPPQPGRGPAADYSRAGLRRGGARSSEAPHRAEPRRPALLGVLRRVFPRSDTASRPGPS